MASPCPTRIRIFSHVAALLAPKMLYYVWANRLRPCTTKVKVWLPPINSHPAFPLRNITIVDVGSWNVCPKTASSSPCLAA